MNWVTPSRAVDDSRALAILTTFMCLCGAAACGQNGDGRESPGDKREWAILQGLELESRDSIPSGPELRAVSDYEVLTIPSLDGSKRIWVMLWPKSPPFYKQMPAGNFEVSKAFLDELQRDNKVSSTVIGALASHIAEQD